MDAAVRQRRRRAVSARPVQHRRGPGRRWLLCHESDSPVRLLVAADRAARKHPATAVRAGRAGPSAGVPGCRACQLLTSRGSAHGAGWLPTFRIGPAFVFEQVRNLDPRAPCVWRIRGLSRLARLALPLRRHGYLSRTAARGRLCPTPVARDSSMDVASVTASDLTRHSPRSSALVDCGRSSQESGRQA